MRFDALHVPAYGPFTDLRLDFPAGDSDLHVIYGPNEAGKSSLLRAIGDLLFEIPVRSPDDFLHEYKRMKIGADLRSRDGRTLTIHRRKRARETLLGADEMPLPDDTLIKWLGHADRRYFTTMFGLASAELRKGAEELLRGEGDLGKALFSASLGGTPVHKIQEALEESARLLFANRARASIRTSAGAYADELKLSKDCLVKAEDWEILDRELAEAKQRQAAIDERKLELQKQINWLQRCEDSLLTLGKLRAKEQALAELPPAPQVPSHFVEEARALLLTKRQMDTDLRRCREEMTRLETLCAECQPREELLAHETEIESRHHAFSLYSEQCARLAKAEADLTAQELGLKAGMRDLGIAGEVDVLESMRLTAADMARVKELAMAVIESAQKLESHAHALRDKEAAIGQLQSKLDQLVATDVTVVREAVTQAAAAAEAQRKLHEIKLETAKAERELGAQQSFLDGAPVEAAAVYVLRVPAKAAAKALQLEQEELLRSKKTLESELAEASKQLAKWKRELAQIERRGALPSIKDLVQAREQRETVWRKIVDIWTRGDAEGRESLVSLHEQNQQHADELADELREHADQVAKADQVRDHIIETEEDIVVVTEQLEALSQSLLQWQERWHDLWRPAGIAPRSPEEMNEWREQWLEFRSRFERWQLLNDGLIAGRALIAQAEQELREALKDTQRRAFSVLYDEARRMVVKADNDQGARAAFEQELAKAKQEREHLDKLAENWAATVKASSEAWKRAAVEWHLNGDISPAAGLDLIARRRELIQRFDAWKALQSQCQQLRAETQAYVESLTALAAGLGVATASADVLDSQLWRMLNEAREARNTQRKLTADLAAARAKERDLQNEGEAAATTLAGLLHGVALEDERELEPLLITLETRGRLTSERDQLCESLNGPARGEPLETFIARVQAQDGEMLPAEKNRLEAELAALEVERHEAIKTVVEATQRQTLLKQAGDAAAMHRQRAESHAASLRTDAARYLRLRLATHFLERQIERFRQENQAPLMKRASALFKAMTLNSFDGLTTGYTDHETQVIVGHRGDTNVPVTGMSEGTRDQLYLSLRLAAIERHIEVHEPLPLILDDLLMTFDDTRTAAILPVLRDLSTKTQILLFTHHEHLIDLCQRTLGPREFTVHRLGAR